MDLSVILKLLEENKEKFKCVDFAYILPTEKLEFIQFHDDDGLYRFANSREEGESYILLTTNEVDKGFAISMPDYDAVIIDDGNRLFVHDYWKGKPAPPEEKTNSAPIDPAELRKEIERLFQLAQEEGNLLHTFH